MHNIPTTYEMDGLYTQRDIEDRYKLMAQCNSCGEYSQWDTAPVVDQQTLLSGKRPFKCLHCGSNALVQGSGVSLRTYNPHTHNKNKKRKK